MPRVEDVERAHSLALNLAAQRVEREALEAIDAEQGALYARKLRCLAELARLSGEKPAHAIMEVAGTFGVGQDRARTLLSHGTRTVGLFPRAMELLEAGALRQATVELLLYVTADCAEQVQAEVGVRITDQLIDCDACDARALIKATVLEVEADLDPQAQADKHAQARANRGVRVKPVEHGMVRIGAEVDQIAGRRFQLDLEELVRLQGIADEQNGVQRTVEQRRADVLAELPSRHLALLQAVQQGRSATDLVADPSGDLLTQLWALPVRNPITLYVHIPMTTVLDLDNRSGWVEGLGPISAHQARLLRPIAALQAVWVDAATGIPLGVDPTAHPPVGEPDWQDPEQISTAAELVRQRLRSMLRPTAIDDRAEPSRAPSASLTRQVKVRDIRCTGPGCPLPASRFELDHLVAVAEGGQTAVWTLALKSPRRHHARHDGWVSVRDEHDGSTLWISPLGGHYRRRSPWRPPPRISKPLPPAGLDRPDGGKERTFGLDPENPVEPTGSAERDDPDAATDPAEQPPPERDRAGEDQPRRKTTLDHARDLRADRPPQQGPTRDRPWHNDGPPPF